MTRRQAPAVDHSGSVYATGYGVASRGLGWLSLIFYPWFLGVMIYLQPWLLVVIVPLVIFIFWRLLRR